jgi:hypothetical protein
VNPLVEDFSSFCFVLEMLMGASCAGFGLLAAMMILQARRGPVPATKRL